MVRAVPYKGAALLGINNDSKKSQIVSRLSLEITGYIFALEVVKGAVSSVLHLHHTPQIFSHSLKNNVMCEPLRNCE